jgi:hypothetical protein
LFTQHQLPNDRQTGAARTQRYRMVNEGRGWELFDMEADPGQKQNIAAERPEVVKKLASEYEQWWNQILPQAQPLRLPIPVGYAAEPVVELPASQAQFDGGIRFNGRHPNNAWLTGWTNRAAVVEWELEVVRDGKYEIGLQYLYTSALRPKGRACESTSLADSLRRTSAGRRIGRLIRLTARRGQRSMRWNGWPYEPERSGCRAAKRN